MVTNGTFCDVSGSSSSQLPTPFPLGADFGGPPLIWVLALQSADVTDASTAETLFVGSTLPSTFSVPFAQIVPGFSENFIAISDLQTVQFSIFTFHEFVTTGMVVAVFIAQISHHPWSTTTGAIVDDCHDVCLYLRAVWEQVLLCCQLSLKICGTHGEENSKSHVYG